MPQLKGHLHRRRLLRYAIAILQDRSSGFQAAAGGLSAFQDFLFRSDLFFPLDSLTARGGLPLLLRAGGNLYSHSLMRTREPLNSTPSACSRIRCSKPCSPGKAIRPPEAMTRCQGRACPCRKAQTT
jgi:hypothetical protein